MFNFKKSYFNNKNKKIFLDNASSTPTLSEVEEEINKYKDLFYNPSAIYSNAVEAKRVINNCRDNISKILSCHSNEIYFASSGTESINMALAGFIKNYYIENI
ncbi:MAG: aminotransferase class V-fold PLP-dependent enzyme [Candidatus Pacebacteria bacterium]|nr:aminotransferase class V-fold PLP-dependent enzyme [Candidatus Paceibacterota bacterium]